MITKFFMFFIFRRLSLIYVVCLIDFIVLYLLKLKQFSIKNKTDKINYLGHMHLKCFPVDQSEWRDGMALIFSDMVRYLLRSGDIAGISIIGTSFESRCRNLVEATGAASRYKYCRSQYLVMVRNFAGG